MAASALLPGYTLWRLKKKKKKTGETKSREQKKKKKDKKSTFSYLRPLTPPSLTCLTPICCHPHSNVFHHNVLCKSQDDSSQGGSEGQEVTAGGAPDIHLSERPPFYPPCTLSLLLMYQSEKLRTAEAPARRHLAAGETLCAKLESEPSLVLKDNVTEMRLFVTAFIWWSPSIKLSVLRKDNKIQSNSCYCKWNIFSFSFF